MTAPTSTQIFIAMTNADRTEGRGRSLQFSIHPDLDGAALAASTSGVQGCPDQVYAQPLGLIDLSRERRVVGWYTDPLGQWRYGLVPNPPLARWSQERVERYKQLREAFPDRPDPLVYKPGEAAALPSTPLFAVVTAARGRIGDYSYDHDEIKAVTDTQDAAVAIAEENAASWGVEDPWVLQVGYGRLPWARHRLVGVEVWRRRVDEPVPTKSEALERELEALEAELRQA